MVWIRLSVSHVCMEVGGAVSLGGVNLCGQTVHMLPWAGQFLQGGFFWSLVPVCCGSETGGGGSFKCPCCYAGSWAEQRVGNTVFGCLSLDTFSQVASAPVSLWLCQAPLPLLGINMWSRLGVSGSIPSVDVLGVGTLAPLISASQCSLRFLSLPRVLCLESAVSS